jgi:hypothetical protein
MMMEQAEACRSAPAAATAHCALLLVGVRGGDDRLHPAIDGSCAHSDHSHGMS